MHNTGAFDSDEVLQIYVTPPARDYRTPAKALVRVRRFHLKCDGSQTVEIPLPESVLYTIDGEGNKVYTKGEYCIRIEDGQSIDQVLTFRNGAEDRIVERCPI